MMTREPARPCLALALALTAMVSHSLHAQPVARPDAASERSAPDDGLRAAWVSGAVGFDSHGDKFVGSVGIHVQGNRVVVSGRKDTRGPGDPDVADAIGMLVGVATKRRSSSAAISVGFSSVDARGYFDRRLGAHHHAMGLAVAGDVALRIGNRAGMGLGLTGFAHMNRAQSFAGVGLQLSIGRWRLEGHRA